MSLLRLERMSIMGRKRRHKTAQTGRSSNHPLKPHRWCTAQLMPKLFSVLRLPD